MKRTLLFILITSVLGTASASDNKDIQCQQDDKSCQLQKNKVNEVMIVHAPTPVPVSGNTYYDYIDIDRLPTRNGNISDLLKSNPTVRFNESMRNSLNQGSIDPENLSFHGASPYQNLFLVEGISATNNIDPANTNMVDNGVNIPSNSQGYFIDVALLDSVRVFDSNVPVEFGQFNGGVVDAKLRKFSGDDKLKISFRTSRDNWTKEHINSRDRESYEAGGNGSTKVYSPNFTKYFYTISGDKQLTDTLGFTVGFSHRESNMNRYSQGNQNIKIRHENTDQINTFLTKLTWLATDTATHNLVIKYNQSNHEIQTPEFINSGRDMGSKSYGLAWEYEQLFKVGKLNLNIGWDHMSNYTKANATTLMTQMPCLYYPESNSCTIGGQGHISQYIENITSKARWDFNPFYTGLIEHNLYLGGEFISTDAETKRYNESENYIYRKKKNSNVYQVMNHYRYQKGKGSLDIKQQSFYLSDTIKLERFSFTPGIRYDHESFLDNDHLSPRLRTEIDVFNNNQTMLTAGYNRYYGTSFLGMGLRDIRSNLRYNAVTGEKKVNITQYKDLKTPYTDEWAIGLQQKIIGFIVGANYVNRHDKDQISRVSIPNGYAYRNDAKSKTDSYNFSVKPIEPFKIQKLEVMPQLVLSYMDKKSNSRLETGYDDDYTSRYDEVVYNGKLIKHEDLPAVDYNTPWIASFNLDFNIPDYNILWANTFTYQSGQDARIIARKTDSCYNSNYKDIARHYCDVSLGSAVIWDAKVKWKPHFIPKAPFTISVDVLNVLDRVHAVPYNSSSAILPSSSAITNYGAGRQFWLQLDYEF